MGVCCQDQKIYWKVSSLIEHEHDGLNQICLHIAPTSVVVPFESPLLLGDVVQSLCYFRILFLTILQ